MAEPGAQRFPKWWQALILLISGIVIGFSSCVGALTGIAGKPSPLEQFYVIGFFVGVAGFLGGVVLFIIVAIRAIVSPVKPAPGLPTSTGVISRATHSQLFPDSKPISPQLAAPLSHNVPAALMWLRIAILASLAFSTAGLFRFAANPRTAALSHRAFPFMLLNVMLHAVPYLVVLYRTRNGPDRVGFCLALATASWSILQSLVMFQRMYLHFSLGITWYMYASFVPGALVIAAAWMVRISSARASGDAGRIVILLVLVWAYFGVVSLTLRVLSGGFIS